MNFNLFYISPELILTIGGILVLGLGLSSRKRSGIGAPEIACALVLFAALIPSMLLLIKGINATQFGSLLAVDGFAIFFKILAILSTAIVAIVSFAFFKDRQFHRTEYYSLLIFATLAITTLAASMDLIMIFLSMEFLSITSYILVGYLKHDAKSNEASIKYFLYGSIASAVMLYGMSMLYGLTGTTNILDISTTFRLNPASEPLLMLSAVMVLVGLGFKIAMVPFHQWSPDTYEGAPTPITAFLSVGSKAAGFAVLVRVLATGISPDILDWTPLIIVLSGITMTLGNLIAIPQTNIKRMLAYSSIAHAGYLLLGVAAMTYSPIAIPAILIYLFAYLFMNLGAFAVVILISSRLGSDDIRDYAGLVKRAPVPAFALVIFLLSLSGIPPTAGFFGKFYLFSAAIQSNNPAIFWLTVVAIVNTIISVYYYLNVVRQMFFVRSKQTTPIRSSRPLNFVIGLTMAMTLAILLYPQPFIVMAQMSARMIEGM